MATANPSVNPDALPQLIGEFEPVDHWQMHINRIFYGLHGARVREFYQTFASADFRLAHALAADYYERARKRDKGRGKEPVGPLVIHEWGPGNGNLAACFLTHLRSLDKDALVYPRVRYVLVDNQESALEQARNHRDLQAHLDRVETHLGDVTALTGVSEATVDRIFCNELWNDLPTKLMLRKSSEIEEEYLRPNLSERLHAKIEDWPRFVHAFEQGDLSELRTFPPFLEEIVWEREYRNAEWKDVPYRKTLAEFFKKIDEQVLVPVNLGACATVKEAKRLLRSDGIGFSAFDAGTADLSVLNDPDKPCYGQFGGQYSFMVNFALVEAVSKHLHIPAPTVESQHEFVGRSLGINVVTAMDVLATHPRVAALKPWERDRLVLRTIQVLNQSYRSPYERRIEFPLRDEMPTDQRPGMEALLNGLSSNGVPDTIAYLSEDEVRKAAPDLEALGYEPDGIEAALRVPLQGVEYCHFSFGSKS